MKDTVPVRESQKVPGPLASDQCLFPALGCLLGWLVGSPTWGAGHTQVLSTRNRKLHGGSGGLNDLGVYSQTV